MSRPDDYEELPGGTEPLNQAVAPPHGTQGAPNEPAAGTPHLAHQGLGGGSGLQQLPPFPQHLANLPGAAEEWDRNAVFCSVWLVVGVVTAACSLLVVSPLGIAAGICATIAAATHRFPRCREGLSLADAVARMLSLAASAAFMAWFDAITSGLFALHLSAECPSAADREGCARYSKVLAKNAFGLAYFAVFSAEAVRRTARMRHLLNPVSSGAVTV